MMGRNGVGIEIPQIVTVCAATVRVGDVVRVGAVDRAQSFSRACGSITPLGRPGRHLDLLRVPVNLSTIWASYLHEHEGAGIRPVPADHGG
jgi:hypothetical protein